MNNEYKSFSERYGYTKPKAIQLKNMDDGLRNGLWNALYHCAENTLASFERPTPRIHPMFRFIWISFLKKPADEYTDWGEDRNKIFVKDIFQSSPWHEVFDLIEFIISGLSGDENFINACNQTLERENSAYKIIQGVVAPITSQEEIESIETALNAPFDSVKKHIHQALTLLSDKENPDYRNSIKESIIAVESLAKEITGNSKGTLGELTSSLNLHPAFSTGLSNLYGFTNDAKGIRHGGTGQPLEFDQSTARFMLITCSAFVNFIVSEGPKKS